MMQYVREHGPAHETREGALDTLAGALAIENIHFGFVDSLHRVVLFADCGDFTRGLSKNQMLVSGVVGKGFKRRQPCEAVVMANVQSYSTVQRMTTLQLMASRSPWLLFGHDHPKDPGLCILYLNAEHMIAGISTTPCDFDILTLGRDEVSNAALVLLKASDVHALVIYTDGDTNNDSYVVDVLHSTPTGRPTTEVGLVVILADQLVNLRVDTHEQLAPLVEKMFPHLKPVGSPLALDDGTVFDNWHIYTDDIGAKELTDSAEGRGYRLPYPDNVHPIK